MQEVYKSILPLLKQNAPFALVIGHNHTTLGGVRFDINTPKLLGILASKCGWSHEESINLQTYQRYGLNSNNAVKSETLLILRKL